MVRTLRRFGVLVLLGGALTLVAIHHFLGDGSWQGYVEMVGAAVFMWAVHVGLVLIGSGGRLPPADDEHD